MNIAAFWIKNRVVTLVLTFFTIAAGLSSFNGMSRLEDPEFTIKDALVLTPYPGASAEDVAGLRDILERAKDSLDRHEGWEAYVDADARLHMTLARITGNTIYAYIQTAIHENINRYYAEFLEHEEAVLREHYKDLCKIVDAVAQGDGGTAFDKMRLHLNRLGQGTIK